MGRRFSGFGRHAVDLLRELDANNRRAWFIAHQQRFHKLLFEPALDLVVELGPRLRQHVAADLRAEPRVGGSIRRLELDGRFHRGAPFRTCLELWFWQGHGPSHQHPGFFVRLTPEHLVLGAGMTLFTPGLLHRYRELVDAPATGRELAGLLQRFESKGMRIAGEWLPRTPRPFPGDHERAALLRRVGLLVEWAHPIPFGEPEAVVGPGLPDLVINRIPTIRPLHTWLVSADADAMPRYVPIEDATVLPCVSRSTAGQWRPREERSADAGS